MQRIDLVKERPELEVAGGGGLLFDEAMVDRLIEETCEVYTPQGELLAKYLHDAFPLEMHQLAYEALKTAATITENRGMAGGIGETGEKQQMRVKTDGTVSKTNMASNFVKSGIVGYFDRYVRNPYCRQTAWTMEHQDHFMAALPAIQHASNLFREHIHERWQNQKEYVERTHGEWIIPGTVFTTVTVNSNFQTAQHQDAGDLRQGFGVMCCLGHGFTGGYLLFPKYRVAFKMRPGDLILANVHEWHCNTPIKITEAGGERLSLVLYFRENMERCGTQAEELDFAKNRKLGDPLWQSEAPLFE